MPHLHRQPPFERLARRAHFLLQALPVLLVRFGRPAFQQVAVRLRMRLDIDQARGGELLQLRPAQGVAAGADEVGVDEQRGWKSVLAQQRQRVAVRGLVAVVDGQDDGAPRQRLLAGEEAGQVGKTDHAVVVARQPIELRGEVARRHDHAPASIAEAVVGQDGHHLVVVDTNAQGVRRLQRNDQRPPRLRVAGAIGVGNHPPALGAAEEVRRKRAQRVLRNRQIEQEPAAARKHLAGQRGLGQRRRGIGKRRLPWRRAARREQGHRDGAGERARYTLIGDGLHVGSIASGRAGGGTCASGGRRALAAATPAAPPASCSVCAMRSKAS